MSHGARNKKKKFKIVSSSTLVSDSLPDPPVSQSSTHVGAHEITSFKRSRDGTLKVAAHKVLIPESTEERTQEPPTRTVGEVMASLLEGTEKLGWDQGYIDSFLEEEVLPDVSAVELEREGSARAKGQGVRAIRFAPSFHFVEWEFRIKLSIDGLKK